MIQVEHIVKSVRENQDKIELGPPGKRFTVHGDFSKPEDFKQRIKNAREITDLAVPEVTK